MKRGYLLYGLIMTVMACCFQVFGDDPITIVASGNVGINNSNPQYQLDINGTTNANGSLFIHNGIDFTGPGGSYQGLFKDNTIALALGGTTETTTRIYLFGEDFSETEMKNEIWLMTPGGNKSIYLSGNVGIGTNNPEAMLHVSGNLLLNNSGNPAIYGGTGTTELNRQLLLYNSPGLASAMGLKSGGLLVADTYTYATPGKNDLIVKGIVGINTASLVNWGQLQIGNTGTVEILFRGSGNANIENNDGNIYLKAGTGYGLFFGSNYENSQMVLVNGNLGIGTSPLNYRLDVSGTTRSTGGFVTSDIRWKKNIRPLEKSLDAVLNLQGVTYNWKKEEYPQKNFPESRQIGFIAQAVESIIPEIVDTDNEGYKSVDYSKLTAVLVEAVKELKAEKDLEINLLQQEIRALKAELAAIKQNQ